MPDSVEKLFVSIKEASQLSGLTQQTLRKLADNDQLDCYKTPSGQRKFNKSALIKFTDPKGKSTTIITNTTNCNNTTSTTSHNNFIIDKKNFIYTRLSKKKNVSECCKEIELLKQKHPKYYNYTHIIEEDCSNCIKSSGFLTIIDSCLQKSLNELVIIHRGDLVHLFYDFVQALVHKSGGKLVIINDNELTTEDKEIELDKITKFYRK